MVTITLPCTTEAVAAAQRAELRKSLKLKDRLQACLLKHQHIVLRFNMHVIVGLKQDPQASLGVTLAVCRKPCCLSACRH
jgi:hypothetical protein